MQEILGNVQKVFGEDGLLVRDGGTFNSAQLQYATAVTQTLHSTRSSDNAPPIGMLEAATGTGKTLGYLVPALLCAQKTNARVVVSTYTRQLQRQLFNEDTIKAAAYIKELTGQIIKVERRFGRNNYLSLEACQIFLDLTDDDMQNQSVNEFVRCVIQWGERKKSPVVVLDDFLDENGLGADDVPEGLDFSALANSELRSDAEIAMYEETIKLTNQADLLIVNHALSVINARSWMSVLDAGDRKNIYIFDEADKLDTAAHSVASKYIALRQSLSTILAGVNAYSKSCGKRAKAVSSKLEQSITVALGNDKQVSPEVLSNIKDLIAVAQKSVMRAATSIVTGKQSLQEQIEKAEFIDSYNNLAFSASLISRGAPSILSASPTRGFPRLLVGQDNPSSALARLWSIYPSKESSEESKQVSAVGVIFTSATLTTRSGSFLPVASILGINGSINKSTGEPFHNAVTDLWASIESDDFGSMNFVLPDQRIPHPTLSTFERGEDDEKLFEMSKKWLGYVVNMTLAAHNSGGRTLVLTNSFKASQEIASRLRMHSQHVIEHERGESLGQLIAGFVADSNSVLVTHGAWEGLNLPNTIKHIVIPRIPYAPPSGERERLRSAALAERGVIEEKAKGIAYSDGADDVVRKLKQGIGRGVRAKSDSVTIWLADPRFPMPRAYRESFDNLLMSFPQRQRGDVMGFIPKRFLANYNTSPLFIDGQLYEVAI